MSCILIEVAPSQSNITLPVEEEEEWTANASGGFDRGTLADIRPRLQSAIRKKKKRPSMGYFTNHCENTQCTFALGHDGLCSHQLVTGRRGGRVLKVSFVVKPGKLSFVVPARLGTSRKVELMHNGRHYVVTIPFDMVPGQKLFIKVPPVQTTEERHRPG